MSEQIVQAEIRTLVDRNTEVYPRSIVSAIGMEGEDSSKTLKQVLKENTFTNSTQNQTLESHTSSINSLDSRLTILEGSASKVEKTFDYMSEQPSVSSTQTLSTSPEGLDTWTTTLTKEGAVIGTKTEAQTQSSEGLDIWTTTINFNNKNVTITDTETSTGWNRTVVLN